MFTLDSIKEEFKNKKINVFNVHMNYSSIEKCMLFYDYNEFLEFIDKSNVSNVFIYDQLLDVENYLITKETAKKIDINWQAVEIIAPIIDKYNEYLLDYDFDFPERIFIICMWNNQSFGYMFQNEFSIDGKPLLSAEEKLLELLEDNEKTINSTISQKSKNIEKEEEQLKKDILKDPNFKLQTNARLRRAYIENILKNGNKYPNLLKVWTSYSGLLCQAPYTLIEVLWREFKNNT